MIITKSDQLDQIMAKVSLLPLWTELSRKYLGKDKSVFREVVQESIYDVKT